MWVLLLVGLVVIGGDLLHRRHEPAQVQRLQVLALAAPLLTLYLYRNSYPYYYVSVLPAACLLAGSIWRRLELMEARPVIAGGLALLCAFPVARTAGRWYAHNNGDETTTQQAVIEAVHVIFPEPVAYIDRCGMVASFEKVGPFMSTWGMDLYRQSGVDIMPDLLRDHQPKFVLANSPALELQTPPGQVYPAYRWRPDDYRHLQENFVHHWGPIWVTGKSLTVAANDRTDFEIIVSGPYTVEPHGPVEIDGAVLQPYEVIVLARGVHSIREFQGHDRTVTLRWGEQLRLPDRPPPNRAIFSGFDLGRPPS